MQLWFAFKGFLHQAVLVPEPGLGVMVQEVWVQELVVGLGVMGLGFGVWGLGLGVRGYGFKVRGLMIRVWGLRIRVYILMRSRASW